MDNNSSIRPVRPHLKLKYDKESKSKPKPEFKLKQLFTKRFFKDRGQRMKFRFKTWYKTYYNDHNTHKPWEIDHKSYKFDDSWNYWAWLMNDYKMLFRNCLEFKRSYQFYSRMGEFYNRMMIPCRSSYFKRRKQIIEFTEKRKFRKPCNADLMLLIDKPIQKGHCKTKKKHNRPLKMLENRNSIDAIFVYFSEF